MAVVCTKRGADGVYRIANRLSPWTQLLRQYWMVNAVKNAKCQKLTCISDHAAFDLMLSQPRVLQSLLVWQIAQGFHPKGCEEGLGGDKGIRRAAAGFAGAGADHVAIDQPSDQVAADLLPKNIL